MSRNRSEGYNHPICDQCWFAINPRRSPVRLIESERKRERCCWCGNPTRDGIYRREDPWELPKHTEHSAEREGVLVQ